MNHSFKTAIRAVMLVTVVQPMALVAHHGGEHSHQHDWAAIALTTGMVALVVLATVVFPKIVNDKIRLESEEKKQ